MGNHKFRISSMLPSSWFYNSKKASNKITKKQPITTSSPQTSSVDQRKSYYFTRDVIEPEPKTVTRSPDPPRKSSKNRRPSSPKKRVTPDSVSMDSTDIFSPEYSVTCSCKTNSSNDDVYGKDDLPPIVTKLRNKQNKIFNKSTTQTRSPNRRMIKGNCYSPRIGNRVKVHGIHGGRKSYGSRRSLSESMAVVKTSVDPGKDFKESMVEMILENNMKSSKDLEDLLACYLSLNSNEYHDLIIKVFKQIWFESTNITL